MFEKLKESKLLFWSVELLVLATLVFVSSKINFLFSPIGTFFSTLFVPILVAGFLYYILNPLVHLLTKLKVKRLFAIILVFLLLLLVIVLALGTMLPKLTNQLSSLASSMPSVFENVENWVIAFSKSSWLKDTDVTNYIQQLDISYSDIIQKFLSSLSSSLGSIFSTIASATVIIFTAPFILFYMLKDGDRLVPSIQRLIPEHYRNETVALLHALNQTLSNYISGQAIECLFVGTFTIIGYSIVGVKYAFLFGVIAGLTNLIPYLGPYLGLAPAVFVTVFDDPLKALFCCVVVLIVQQIDGNIIYPNVIGKSLQIHPLTIILILLVAGNIAGLLGIFLGVPFYAICRTIVTHVYGMIQQYKVREVKKNIDISMKS